MTWIFRAMDRWAPPLPGHWGWEACVVPGSERGLGHRPPARAKQKGQRTKLKLLNPCNELLVIKTGLVWSFSSVPLQESYQFIWSGFFPRPTLPRLREDQAKVLQ